MSSRAMKQVWDSPWKGRSAMWAVHVAVADTVNEAHGYRFWMSRQNLADKAGVSVRTVCDWVREAVEIGVVELVEDNSVAGRPNRYQFILDPSFDLSDEAEGVGNDCLGVGDDCLPGRQPLPRGRQPLPSEQETNKKENSKEVNLFGEEVDENATEEEKELQFTSSAKIVLSAWVESTGRDQSKVKLNAKRLAAVKARLREGYSVGDLCAAARGISVSAWHQGDNPEGKKYDDLLVAIRDGDRVEKFRDLWEQGGDKPKRSAVDTVLEMFSNRGQSGQALARALTEGSES